MFKQIVFVFIHLFALFSQGAQEMTEVYSDVFLNSTMPTTQISFTSFTSDNRSETKKFETKITNNHSSSTNVYVVVLLGIAPAALGACFYCFKSLHKRWKANKSNQNNLSTPTFISINNSNEETIREYRYNENLNGLIDKENSKIIFYNNNICTESNNNSCSGSSERHFVRKRRVYSIEYPRKNIELQEVLGEGNFGLVWKGKVKGFRENGIVAVKTAKNESGEKEWYDLLQEVNIMLQLGQHQNVVRLLGCCTEKVPYYLIMEFVENGKLLTFLRQYRGSNMYYIGNQQHLSAHKLISLSDLIKFAYQVAKGMEFISSHGIIHRDLAARNVLVDCERNCKIADFGLARNIRDNEEDMYEQLTKGAMPIRWMAPESLYLNHFTTKSDVWSFAILFWEILTLGSTPYPGLSATEVITNVKLGVTMEKPNLQWCTEQCYQIMNDCWAQCAKRRPTFSQLKEILTKMLNDQLKEYLVSNNLRENFYYNIIYKSPGEKV